MAGMDAATGLPLDGWPHVLQSIGQIIATRFGERVMRPWFGSAVPGLLGQLQTPQTVLRFFSAVTVALELWEPRFKVKRLRVLDAARDGRAGLWMEGEYRPRGHLGDPTPAPVLKTLFYGANGPEAA